MSQPSLPVRTVQPSDWVATYFIGVAALALVLTLTVCVILQVSNRDPWSDLGGSISFYVVVLLSTVVIGISAALPSVLFFWLAQRFTWHRLPIYLVCGALAALPTIAVVKSLLSGFISLSTNAPGVARYLPAMLLFSASGAFLGAIFWWRSGRHLR
ncbi:MULTISPECIES: hypothetical protein [unclassified Pseudomonas]|uniref:hypothetical protein n=1 Tax=unclassified Pseudomonas TaxID=196821 RepID=UPI000CD2F9C9|nr:MULTISPECIES: hypothetical protein [unclassified Pseudomonas]POA53635.1 hypothetical protein C1889_18835 [Pseudomonas sp. FW507-12TSA]